MIITQTVIYEYMELPKDILKCCVCFSHCCNLI